MKIILLFENCKNDPDLKGKIESWTQVIIMYGWDLNVTSLYLVKSNVQR